MATGHSYYNLTKATDLLLDLAVTKASSAKLLIVVLDGSDNKKWYVAATSLDTIGNKEVVLRLANATAVQEDNGAIGNSQIDLEYVKGVVVKVELDDDSTGGQATGSISVDNPRAVFNLNAQTTDEYEAALQDKYVPDDDGRCVVEEGLLIDESFYGFERVWQGRNDNVDTCCDLCTANPDCLYALSVLDDNTREGDDSACYLAIHGGRTHLDPAYIGLLDTDLKRATRTVFWMDSASKRGDFCDLCTCNPDELSIDCTSQDLVIAPKTFKNQNWRPKHLDLRLNHRLTLLGSDALAEIADSLETITLPRNLKHLSPLALSDIPNLAKVEFEDDPEHRLVNAIQTHIVVAGSQQAYSDVCCGRGEKWDLNKNGAANGRSFTFCDYSVTVPGIDATFNPFIRYPEALVLQVLTPTSLFMSEAAESVEKCAEYCFVDDGKRFCFVLVLIVCIRTSFTYYCFMSPLCH